ncbi:MAG: RdgB/HAM1 family non-canonical purine NTP pyrophosphatase [bacterium]
MKEIVLATCNRHKAAEISALVPDIRLRFLNLADFPPAPAVEEDGATLEENAVKKAVSAARITGRWALADDTGLEVEFLKGAPGVKSARFAGPDCSCDANNRKLLESLSGVPEPDRKACFRCVMALASPDGMILTEEGRLEGSIAAAYSGSNGFGYDPLFLVAGTGRTLAQMSAGEKNSLSHRAMAMEKMIKHFPALG